MKVYTDYLPLSQDYLTVGKHYNVTHHHAGYRYLVDIEDDAGDVLTLIITNDEGLCCSFLGEITAWKVVQE